MEFITTREESSTQNHALDIAVPQDDIDNALPNQDPRARATMVVTDRVELNREKRVADIVHSAATYPAAQVDTLAGTDQFSDFTNSDPVGVLTTRLSSMPMRATAAVFGRGGWDIFKRHPKIINSITGQAGVTNGVARREAVADLLELENIYVGDSWGNLAKPGQAANRQRLWSNNHIALLYQSPLGNLTQGSATFMITAQWGNRVAGRRRATCR